MQVRSSNLILIFEKFSIGINTVFLILIICMLRLLSIDDEFALNADEPLLGRRTLRGNAAKERYFVRKVGLCQPPQCPSTAKGVFKEHLPKIKSME